MKCALILAAAGRGLRFKSRTRKQFLKIKDKPLFLYALETFFRIKAVSEYLLIVPPAEMEKTRRLFSSAYLKKHRIDNRQIKIIGGSTTRCRSVYAGLKKVNQDTELVMIHDAARPLISAPDIRNLLKLAAATAVVPATPLTDTVKKINKTTFNITGHPRRSAMAAVSTPQCFPYKVLYKHYQKAVKKKNIPTDDAEVYKASRKPIKIYMLKHPNPKLTGKHDLELIKTSLQQNNK